MFASTGNWQTFPRISLLRTHRRHVKQAFAEHQQMYVKAQIGDLGSLIALRHEQFCNLKYRNN